MDWEDDLKFDMDVINYFKMHLMKEKWSLRIEAFEHILETIILSSSRCWRL